jgi:hypothetical protein
LTDAAADNVAVVAARLTAGRSTLADLLTAVDAYRDADSELSALLSLRLQVNGRTYTLTRPSAHVRGVA